MSLVQIVLGSASDAAILDKSGMIQALDTHDIPYELHVCSAHRNDEELAKLVEATINHTLIYVGIAGMTAALPGALAALTKQARVIVGVPLDEHGIDACLHMPPGVPVVTVGVGVIGLKNATAYIFQDLAKVSDRYKIALVNYLRSIKKEAKINISLPQLLAKDEKRPSRADVSAPQPFHSGKVRDSYLVDEQAMLIVASDRVSVFDVVLPTPIPGKGKQLTKLTDFWLRGLLSDIPNHLYSDQDQRIPAELQGIPDYSGRSTVVRRAEMLPIECIVRGYLYGSVMKEYSEKATASGVSLPEGLEKASKLPEPIFTPSTKAPQGQHDENITLAQAEELVDPELLARVRELSLEIYGRAANYAAERGIILADTKLEFGLIDGVLTLCDEVLTPDSSRYWDAASWVPGEEPTSYDKQFVRNYASTLGWNKKSPGPELPTEIVEQTQAKYADIVRILTS